MTTDLRQAEQIEEIREKRKFRYLPELDGLRGIGLIGMLLYHSGVIGDGALFTIEMFFALSGFLIASLFIVERHNTGRINLKRFWHRRFRRLGPALVPLFVIVTLYAVWSATAVEMNRMRGDGIATLLYSSNWWFIFSGVSYFEGFSAPSPFRHTWSLSIEEQFYLIVAVGFYFMFRKWGPDKKWYPHLMFGLAVLSALWMAFLARMSDLMAQGLWPLGIDPASLPSWAQTFFNFRAGNDPSRVYYGTDTRLQGSLVGVAMAFVVARLGQREFSQRTYEIMAFVGVGGLLLMFFGITGHGLTWIYYGAFFVADLLTAVAILAMLSPKRTLVGRALAWKPLVWIGVLSYSVYVLHWPIFVWLDNQTVLEIEGWAMVALKIGLAFIVAYLSYRFYENKIRIKGLPNGRQRLAMVVACVVVLGSFLTVTTSRAQSGEEAIALPTTPDGRIPVVMAGDSMPHTLVLHLNAAKADADAGIVLYPATTLGCGLTAGDSYLNGRLSERKETCLQWPDLWQRQVDRVNPAVSFMLAWGWDLYDRRIKDDNGEYVDLMVGTPEWAAYEGETIQRGIDILSSGGGKVVLLTMPCIDLEADTPQHTNEEVAEDHRVQAMDEVIRLKAAENAAITSVMDLNGLLCDGESYKARIDGELMSPDGIHPTPEGAKVIWNWMLPQLYDLMGIESKEDLDARLAEQKAADEQNEASDDGG